jgi:FkbM family methyltransferase
MTNRILSRAVNRLVTMIPVRHRFRMLAHLHAHRGALGPELFRLNEYLDTTRRRVAVDIGANQGVTSWMFSQIFEKVYAIEANVHLLKEWSRSAPRNVTTIPYAVSDQSGIATLNIPVINGVALSGWASMQRPYLQAIDSMRAIEVERRTVDSLNLDGDIDFIKIDVEGHEVAVLMGARNLLTRHRPWMVIEVQNENRETLHSLLMEFDYEVVDLQSILGLPSPTKDLVVMPR